MGAKPPKIIGSFSGSYVKAYEVTAANNCKDGVKLDLRYWVNHLTLADGVLKQVSAKDQKHLLGKIDGMNELGKSLVETTVNPECLPLEQLLDISAAHGFRFTNAEMSFSTTEERKTILTSLVSECVVVGLVQVVSTQYDGTLGHKNQFALYPRGTSKTETCESRFSSLWWKNMPEGSTPTGAQSGLFSVVLYEVDTTSGGTTDNYNGGNDGGGAN